MDFNLESLSFLPCLLISLVYFYLLVSLFCVLSEFLILSSNSCILSSTMFSDKSHTLVFVFNFSNLFVKFVFEIHYTYRTTFLQVEKHVNWSQFREHSITVFRSHLCVPLPSVTSILTSKSIYWFYLFLYYLKWNYKVNTVSRFFHFTFLFHLLHVVNSSFSLVLFILYHVTVSPIYLALIHLIISVMLMET